MVNKVEMVFARFARTMGKKIGGYKVAEKRGHSSGEYDLFDQQRRRPADFVRWVDAVCAAKRQK